MGRHQWHSFGHGGQNPEGIRVGGEGGQKRLLKFGSKDNLVT